MHSCLCQAPLGTQKAPPSISAHFILLVPLYPWEHATLLQTTPLLVGFSPFSPELDCFKRKKSPLQLCTSSTLLSAFLSTPSLSLQVVFEGSVASCQGLLGPLIARVALSGLSHHLRQPLHLGCRVASSRALSWSQEFLLRLSHSVLHPIFSTMAFFQVTLSFYPRIVFRHSWLQ